MREPWLRRVLFVWDIEDDGLIDAPQGRDVGGEKEGKSCACSYLWYRLFRFKDNTSGPLFCIPSWLSKEAPMRTIRALLHNVGQALVACAYGALP